MHVKRSAALKDKLSEIKIDAALILKPENVYYISGFKGSDAYVVLTDSAINLLTDFRYLEQAEAQAPHCNIIDIGHDFYGAVRKGLGPAKSIGYEENFLTVKQFQKLQSDADYNWIAVDDVIQKLRTLKDDTELEDLRRAAKIADQAFLHILSFIKPGISEIDIAAEMEHFMRKAGSEGPSFDFIIASGERGSLPHGIASEKKITAGELITMDFGAIYKGYHSDITRTVAVGNIPLKLKAIYDLVHQAQAESLEMVKAGICCKEIDAKARGIIKSAGFGENFRHGLGHGVGLEIHEEPRFNTLDETILAPNMVVTVEPGVYLSGIGGVRIEDSVIVTKEGYELLTQVAKDLIIL